MEVPVESNISDIGVSEQKSYDPTETKTLRDNYESQFYNRWRGVRGTVRESIVDNDAFSLSSAVLERPYKVPRSFKSVVKSKAEAFRSWLKRTINQAFGKKKPGQGKILQKQPPKKPVQPPKQPPQGVPKWVAAYVLASYIKGLVLGNSFFDPPVIPPTEIRSTILDDNKVFAEELRKAMQEHMEDINQLIERVVDKSYNEVKEGLDEGKSRYEIVKSVNNIIREDGVKNGRRIANTKVMSTVNNALIKLYQREGISEVSVRWTTRRDDKVCGECLSHADDVYPVEEAFGILPAHPMGRCYFRPVKQ